MRKIRLALSSNDGKNIIPDHMGTANDFFVFDLFEDGSSILVEKRKNTSPQENEKRTDHGDLKKLQAAMKILEDCDVVLGRKPSPNFVRMRDTTRFQPVVTQLPVLSATLIELARSFEEIYALVERRNRGEKPQIMPIVGRRSEP